MDTSAQHETALDTRTPLDVASRSGAGGPSGRSWDADMLGRLADHVRAESTLIDEYAEAARTVDEPDVRYLIELIVDDEARHHRNFAEIVHAVESVRSWRDVEPSVPPRGTRPLSAELRATTERFLEAEREDRRHLKDLRRRLAPVADTTLWALLVDMMLLDTEKHIRILETIAARK